MTHRFDGFDSSRNDESIIDNTDVTESYPASDYQDNMQDQPFDEQNNVAAQEPYTTDGDPDENSEKSSRKKNILIAVGGILIGTLLTGGIAYAAFGQPDGNNNNQQTPVLPNQTSTATSTVTKEKQVPDENVVNENKRLKADNNRYRDSVKQLRDENQKLKDRKPGTKTITVPGPTKTVETPGPTKVIEKPAPTPTKDKDPKPSSSEESITPSSANNKK